MKKNIFWTILIIFILIIGCSSLPIYKSKVIEKYTRNLRYESDTIYLRENNVFTRKINYLGFPKKYYGFYSCSNDTIYLQYHKSDRPKDELSFVLKKNNSIIVFEIYERIKEKYSYYSADELSKIDKKELMRKDTALIEYKLKK